jgi:glucose-1-phosphate thymidylyltransferase
MDYVMDAVSGFDVDELIVITGHLKDQVERYITSRYNIGARFVEQKTLDGTAGAVDLARPYVDQDVLIIFVDTLFEADLSVIRTAPADGIIWAKEVEDYQRYGVIVTDRAGYMERIVEKPDTPVSRLANIGLHYVKDWRALFAGIDHVRRHPAGKGGEFYLTDAFQHMVDQGRRIYTAPVAGWYDCGKLDTLLETNRHLLETGRAQQPATLGPGCTIVPPVHIEDGVTIRDSRIGPNVTIETGSTISDSRIADAILGRDVRVERATVREAVIGDGEVVTGREIVNVVIDGGEEASAR